MTKTEKVLIVGGGFAGVKTALELSQDQHFSITLLSDSSEFRYYPTLYRTATGGERTNSSIALASILAGTGVNIVQGEAETLDRKAKTITTKTGDSLNYDTLLIALGVVTNYFGINGLAEYSYSIKSQSEVARFKAHLHKQLIDDQKPDLNYAVVGAGPTGIELAGVLPSYLEKIMKNHGLPPRKVNVDLIEAMPRLLPTFPKSTSSRVKRRLHKLGVKLYLGSSVQGETIDSLMINNKPVSSHTVVWTAGVTNHPFFAANNFVMMGRGKVGVDTYLQAERDIFVLGDNANTPYSGTAQTALRDGIFIAENLKRRANGKDFKSYIAKKPITVIPVGPHWAAVIWGKFQFHGILGYSLRQMADLKGFHDLEHWPEATKQFLKEFTVHEDCSVCGAALGQVG